MQFVGQVIFRYGPLALAFFLLCVLIFVLFRPGAFGRGSKIRLYCIAALVIAIAIALPIAADGAMRTAELVTSLIKPPPAATGPHAVAGASLTEPPWEGSTEPARVQIWLPTILPSRSPTGETRSCAQVLTANPPPQATGKIQIVLYAPSMGGDRFTNARLLENLASHGYLVLAIDDLSLDPGRIAPQDSRMINDLFTLTSEHDYQELWRLGTLRAELEAKRALLLLDRLEACASSVHDWRSRLDFARVGFLGYSFGGAAAAEASIIDDRIAAVVNFDGTVFDPVARGALHRPYLAILSNIGPPPSPAELTAHPWDYREDDEDVRFARAQATRPESHVVWIAGAYHESFADAYFHTQKAYRWLLVSPARTHNIMDTYVLDFFGFHLRDQPSRLLGRPSPYEEVHSFISSASPPVRAATAPT